MPSTYLPTIDLVTRAFLQSTTSDISLSLSIIAISPNAKHLLGLPLFLKSGIFYHLCQGGTLQNFI